MKVGDAVIASILAAIISAGAFLVTQMMHIKEMQLVNTSYIHKVDFLIDVAHDFEERIRALERCGKKCP